jgi:hypothetical protein
VAFGALVAACGGSPPPAAEAPASNATAAAPASAPATATATGPATATATGPATATATKGAAEDAPLDDPNESAGPITLAMAPEFDKSKGKTTFPKKATSDGECWTKVNVSGDHAKDYDAIVAACGAPTGLLEYAKPATGKLHHKHDPADVFAMPLLAGYCYRFFAVADSSINDLDLLIEKPGGALVGDDKTNSPIAIIESDKPWCMDDDLKVEFHVKVDGPGKGGYTFGVWARPKH